MDKRDLAGDGSEGIFAREAQGVVESSPDDDKALLCGYVNITLPTDTPGVAAGDIMKDARRFNPQSQLDHEYEMPDYDQRRFVGGMAPRLIQHNGENVEYLGDDEFFGGDEEWDPIKAKRDFAEGEKQKMPEIPKWGSRRP